MNPRIRNLHNRANLRHPDTLGARSRKGFSNHGRSTMLKPVAALAAAGLVGAVLFKVLLFPFIGFMLGFVVWALKIALIVGLIWWGFWLFRKWSAEKGSEA